MAKEKIICPAISIIIPLYNVEKYVGECLDSILAQTFQDFEVIVVDDCSTDSSPAIVQSYVPKFNGRLQLLKTKKNSGGCAVPRNVGLPFSRGEYIFFVDSDDTITPTALEELYKIAEEYAAQIVHCEKYYRIPDEIWNNPTLRKQLKPYSYKKGEFVKEPTLITSDITERVEMFRQYTLTWNAWNQLIRRDFIFRNELVFGNFFAEDMPFKICEFCCAERVVIVPNVVFNYRLRQGSMINDRANIKKRVQRQVSALVGGVRYLNEFFSEHKVLSQRPDLQYILFDAFIQEMLKYLNFIYTQIPAHDLDELLREEFSRGDNTALTAFIFSKMNIYRVQLLQAQSENAALEKEFKRLQGEVQEIVRKLKQE